MGACSKCLKKGSSVKNGKSKDGRQTYLCNNCGYRYVESKLLNRSTKGKTKQPLKNKQFEQFKSLVYKNDGIIPTLSKIKLSVSRQTLFRWSKKLLSEDKTIRKEEKEIPESDRNKLKNLEKRLNLDL